MLPSTHSNVTMLHEAPPIPTGVSSDRYISEAFLEREKRHIFRKTWLVACPAHKLRRKGAYMVQDEVDEHE